MNFLAKVANSKSKRIPKTFGLVQRKRKNEINMRSFYIPEDYIEPLSTSIYLSTELKKLDLSRTQLDDNLAIKIVNCIPVGLLELTLNHLPDIGMETVKNICENLLEDVRYSLETLNLEDNNLGNECVIRIGKSLEINNNLKVLNLSKNGLTGLGIEEFC